MPDPLKAFAWACQRRDLIRAGGTDALRLLDGAGDGPEFSGLIIDDFAGRWLAQTNGAEPPAWLRAVAPAPISIYWKRLDPRSKGVATPWAGAGIEAPFEISENGLRYRIDFQAGYSQGLFLDQRDNRLAVRQRVSASETVLNCFAYTCAFSVAAAAAGARTVSVDLARRALEWGQENFSLNGIRAEEGHEFLSGDVFDWLKRFGKQGRRFAGIVLDPPTFSRNRAGQVFRVEDDFGRLVELAAPLLTSNGWMLCTTNQRSLPGVEFVRRITGALPAAGNKWKIATASMPEDFTGEPYLRTAWVAG